jgi:hypothetical protein
MKVSFQHSYGTLHSKNICNFTGTAHIVKSIYPVIQETKISGLYYKEVSLYGGSSKSYNQLQWNLFTFFWGLMKK